jgi:anthranilate synthase component 1
MLQALSLEEFQDLAKNAKRIAVFQEIDAGALTPFALYCHLQNQYQHKVVMLETLDEDTPPRYSYLGFDTIDSLEIYSSTDDPLPVLRQKQKDNAFATRIDVAPLITSAFGYVGYAFARCFEDLPDPHPSENALPLLCFNFYRYTLTFNHDRQSILISYLVDVGESLQTDYYAAQEKLNALIQSLSTPSPSFIPATISAKKAEIDVDVTDEDFMSKVVKAKEYIRIGEVFQLVLSRSFERPYSVSPLAIYQALAQVSPAPFMFYFPFAKGIILGASPERMVSVHQGEMRVNPIAGTRRHHGKDKEEIGRNLLQDKKELAEHLMLVDLARNDVGAVSRPGTVVVEQLLQVKHYSHLSHLTSTVIGTLREGYDALDALRSAFPAGTLVGAPKIRAMQLIDSLENSARDLYGGAICRLDGLNDLDSCIAIRMAMLQQGKALIRTGAGIVHDSDPHAEMRETWQKAQSMLHAIAKAEGESYDFIDR